MTTIKTECYVEPFSGIVRVLKKYPFSKHLLFLDVIVCKNAVDSTLAHMSVYSIVIKSEDISNGFEISDDFNVADIHVGDVLCINGVFQSVSEEKNDQLANAGIWKKNCVFIRNSEGGSVKKLVEWDSKAEGIFTFDENQFLPYGMIDLNQISSDAIRIPSLVLQVKNKTSEKVLELLRGMFPSLPFRESAIMLCNSKDRLILCFNDTSMENTLDVPKITSNDLLSQAVARIYPVSFKSFPSTVHPDLTSALTLLYEKINSCGVYSDAIVRIQSYPRHIAPRVVSTLPQMHWSPKGYSHVLSVVLVDAVWMVSLVPSEEIVISDIYENSNKFGSKSTGVEATSDEKQFSRVCKSINKLHEIMTRNDWIYDSSAELSSDRRPFHAYGLCLDIGSSPGGWSTYLARHAKAQRVISVDKGVMNIDPALMPPIEHWQMLGQDAVEQLKGMNKDGSHKIDLYCCDANIAPVLSTALLVKCVEYQLLSEGARFVLTLKNTLGKQKDWTEAKVTCMHMLEEVFDEVHLVSLLANTPKETTVTGVYRAE